MLKDSVSYTTNSNIFQELLCLVGRMVHSDLVRQVEYLKVENQILRKKVPLKRITLTCFEKNRIIRYGKPLGPSLSRVISIVKYKTFLLWLKNKKPRTTIKDPQRGRPKTKKEIQEIILRLARENPWGYTRILAEIKKLNILSVSRNTIKNILKSHGFEPVAIRSADTWDEFIKRHLKTLWACDFFSKTVWTLAGQRTFQMLFFINVATRRVHVCEFTTNPSQEWTIQQAKTIGFLFKDQKPGLLLRDRDTKYSKEFDRILEDYGMSVKKLPFRSPNLNPYAEGWVGTIKRECLDHFFVFGERHLRHLVNEYVSYYNTKRPHSGLGFKPPGGDISQSGASGRSRLCCKETLGGMARHYYWG